MHVLTRALTLCALTSAMAVAPDVTPAGAQVAKPFSYTPGTQRYRLTTVINNQRDQTGGRAPMTYTVTTTQLVTVTLARKSRDTLSLTIKVDSVGVDSPDLDTPKPDLSFEQGVTLKGTMSPTGHIYEFGSRADAANATLATANLAALYKSFQHFLPAFPAPDVHVGLTWSDTAETRELHRSSFDSVITETVTTWKVSADTTVAGSHAWRLDRSSTIELTGDGTEAGQNIHLDGDGSIKSASFVNPAGIYLGAKSSQNVRFVSSFKETGEGAPQTQTIKTTIEPLPPIRTADAGR
jgi:hypothetical protein